MFGRLETGVLSQPKSPPLKGGVYFRIVLGGYDAVDQASAFIQMLNGDPYQSRHLQTYKKVLQKGAG